MNEFKQAELLFTFGSVLVYEIKPKVYDLFNPSVYYWRYKDTPVLYGPFDSIMNCTKHWESTMHSPAPIEQPDMTNVIKVDFKSRKRIL